MKICKSNKKSVNEFTLMKYCFKARDTTSIKLLFSLRSTKRGIKKFCSENYDVFQFCHLEQNRQWEILTQNNYWFMNNAYICDYVIMYYYATRNMSCTINEIKMKKPSYFHDSFLMPIASFFSLNNDAHYSISQIFVQKFKFDKKPNIFTSFSPQIFLTFFLVKSKLSTA